MNPIDPPTDDFPKVRFGLTAKLFLLVLVCFGGLMSFIVYQVGSKASEVADTTIEKSLRQSEVILKTRLDSRFNSVAETAGNLARDGRLLALIYAQESASLQDQCNEFEQSLDFDILIFTNADGVILARSGAPEDQGIYVGDSFLFQEAIAGRPAQGIMRSKTRLLQVVALPIFDNAAPEIVRGTVALAYTLSDDLALEIRHLTGSEIAFYSFASSPLETTSEPVFEQYHTLRESGLGLENYLRQNTELWTQIFNQNASVETDFTIDNEIFHALFQPLQNSAGDPMGFVVAYRSRTELLEPFDMIKHRVLIVGLICLIAASVIAYGIARHISGPVIELVSITKQIQNGNYPESAEEKRGDEVGVLYNAVVRMGQELKEKAELEDYLAGISEGLEDVAPAVSSVTTVVSTVTEQAKTIRIADNELSVKARNQIQPGRMISDRYRIDHAIGSGAMGIVYLAKDVELNEFVALKLILKPEVTGATLEQFKQEIKLARKITHRNVLRTHDFGTFEGLHYISMEYVQGHDLSQLIKKKGPMDIKMGTLLARQMCSAIGAAHAEGVIHRDLKPQNTMINRKGILKIMDFGIAINVEQESSVDGNPISPIFEKDAMVGTPSFMSPEQFSRIEVDLRTDIYSLGIMLYFLFTADLPFTADSLPELAEKHVREPAPKLGAVRRDAPQELENLILKAMAKDRNDRFQSVNELGIALAKIGT